MRYYLIFIVMLLPIISYSQNYSSIISDSEIGSFVQWEILNTSKYSEDKRTGKKRILNRPVSWKEAMVHVSGPFEDTLSFENKFYWFLKKDTIFTREDVAYLSQQYESEKPGIWKKEFEGAKFANRSGVNVYAVTIPLFSKDKSRVMFWKYFYCGSLCAYACVYIYEKADVDNWRLISKYGCWMS